MLSVEDDSDWTRKNENADLFDNSNFSCGEMAIDRLAQAIKGAKIGPLVTPLISSFVIKEDWKFRHAALFALGQVGEELKFEQIPFGDITNYVRDPHPRVRYAALHCLGQLASDFSPRVQQLHHKLLIPACLRPLGDEVHTFRLLVECLQHTIHVRPTRASRRTLQLLYLTLSTTALRISSCPMWTP
jgi:hypothetical protein